MDTSVEYAANESNATNFNGNGFDWLPCHVVCVAATGGGVLLFIVLTAFTLLIICLCLLKHKRGRVEETSEEDIHDYVNINPPGSMDVRQPPLQPPQELSTNYVRDSHYYEQVIGHSNVQPETEDYYYGTVLGTIDSCDYEDILV